MTASTPDFKKWLIDRQVTNFSWSSQARGFFTELAGRDQRDNEELVRRFKNESKAISILDHPNIVKVYDVSVTDRLQYIVMEYVDGITLKEYLKQRGGALTWKETVHFATQVLRALQHAHSKGIIHRDVKPQNIMLLADGSIKMMDFGIARFSRAQSQTVSDKAIGSVHYISPEQAKGDRTDARTDIYSVGVMLYEMLSGRLPFDGDGAVSIAIEHGPDDRKFSGQPRILGPRWMHMPALTVGLLGVQIFWSVEMSYGACWVFNAVLVG